MTKKIISYLLPLMIAICIAIPVASASMHTISGTLSTTDPANNNYQGNYKLTTPNGDIYYLRLEKDLYKDWIGKTAYFNVIGDYYSFAAYSSGLGARTNTLPKTGAEIYIPLLMTILITGVIFKAKKIFLYDKD